VDAAIRVVTWNLFHGRDGLPGLGATRRSTWLRRPEDDGVHVHLNRKLTDLMAERLASWGPDVCALQEVPAAAVGQIARITGMRAIWTTTGPLVGPAWLRDALAARNPDLWRTHEGNANVLLIGPRLELVEGSRASVRLNPIGTILRATRRLGLERGELLRYIPEPRRLVVARIVAPGGAEIAIGCTHCHNARHPDLVGMEIARAASAVTGAARGAGAVLAGDLNARPSHPALAALAEEGWDGAEPGGGMGIDRILHRGMEVVVPARRLDVSEREVGVTWRGRTRRVRLSDHDPVVVTLRPTASASSAARPGAP
jgi:endonuclease/exonuclease/phosphatase family metal-dependent hydrolase